MMKISLLSIDHLNKVLTLRLEFGLGTGLQEFINMPLYLSKKKSKELLMLSGIFSIITENNKFGTGEKSKNLECVRKMDKMNKIVFLQISNDECIEQDGIQVIVLKQFKC